MSLLTYVILSSNSARCDRPPMTDHYSRLPGAHQQHRRSQPAQLWEPARLNGGGRLQPGRHVLEHSGHATAWSYSGAQPRLTPRAPACVRLARPAISAWPACLWPAADGEGEGQVRVRVRLWATVRVRVRVVGDGDGEGQGQGQGCGRRRGGGILTTGLFPLVISSPQITLFAC